MNWIYFVVSLCIAFVLGGVVEWLTGGERYCPNCRSRMTSYCPECLKDRIIKGQIRRKQEKIEEEK
ncbi:MAG: hypothetical protein AB1401_00395 [Thermodesulfobacteriota bacterium]